MKTQIVRIILTLLAMLTFAYAGNNKSMGLKEPTEVFVRDGLVSDLQEYFTRGNYVLTLEKDAALTNEIVSLIDAFICKSPTGKIICQKTQFRLQNSAGSQKGFIELLRTNIALIDSRGLTNPDFRISSKKVQLQINPVDVSFKSLMGTIIAGLYRQIDLKRNSHDLFNLESLFKFKNVKTNSCSLYRILANLEFKDTTDQIRSRRVVNRILDEIGLIRDLELTVRPFKCQDEVKGQQIRNIVSGNQSTEIILSNRSVLNSCEIDPAIDFDQALALSNQPIFDSATPYVLFWSSRISVCDFLTQDDLSIFGSSAFDEIFKVREVRPKVDTMTPQTSAEEIDPSLIINVDQNL